MTVFSKKPVTLVVAAALGLFAAATTTSAIAAPAKVAKPTQNAQANVINFSFAIEADAKLTFDTQAVVTHSDEYYFTVNGSQLNKGIDIHTSEKGALIKISRQGDQGKALKNEALQLRSVTAPGKNLATNIIGESDLSATGIFANSAAFKMADDVQPGSFKLNYDQPLAAKNLYVIHVKEKNSVNKLEISTQKQHYLENEAFTFDAAMLAENDTLALDQVDAFILSPSGKKFTAAVDRSASGVAQITATEQLRGTESVEPPITGLYELHVNADVLSKGQRIRRSGKIAFALAPDTADLNALSSLSVKADKPVANIGVTVKEPGRYEVRGILYGHDAQGNLKPIMETHSAQNFAVAGEQVINVQFDQKMLAKSALKAPFVVKNVRLYDQTRMSRQ